MPLYAYRGCTANGRAAAGVLDAEDQAAAKRTLRDRGIFLTEALTEGPRGRSSLLGRVAWASRPGVKDLGLFTYQLKTLLGAGLPLVDSLTVLVNEEPNRRFKAVLAGVRDTVKDGEPIADALASAPDVFNDLYVNMVAAGDAGGMLEEVLGHLAAHLERQERVSTRVQTAMTYPAFMTAVGFVILSYLLTSVVPRVATVFHDVGKALPVPTVVLITVSDLLATYWPAFLATMAVVGYAGYRVAAMPRVRSIAERAIARIPYVGTTVQAIRTARFARTMEALLRGGVPLARSLGIASRVAGTTRMARALSEAEAAVLEGKSLARSLRASACVPESAVSLVTVGETTGNLEEVFARIGDAREKEVERRLDTLLTLVEPVMILCMGLVVGFVVFAILLPILEMSHLR